MDDAALAARGCDRHPADGKHQSGLAQPICQCGTRRRPHRRGRNPGHRYRSGTRPSGFPGRRPCDRDRLPRRGHVNCRVRSLVSGIWPGLSPRPMIGTEKQAPFRRQVERLLARSRSKNSIYLALSLIARVLNAVGMFIAIQRFAPSTFGEMSYLQATAVSTVAFCSLGIELSVNALLTRKIKEGGPLAPTVLAACILAITGICLACIAVTLGFSSQLTVTGSPHLAVVAVCLYSSLMIFNSLLTAISFALSASINVGVSYILTSSLFASFAIFADKRTSGIGLMFFSVVALVIAVSYMATALSRLSKSGQLRRGYELIQTSFESATAEVKTLFSYGAKQIL